MLEDRLGAEVHEGVRTLDGLGAAAPREAAALDELSRLNQLERQRQAEASIAPLSSSLVRPGRGKTNPGQAIVPRIVLTLAEFPVQT